MTADNPITIAVLSLLFLVLLVIFIRLTLLLRYDYYHDKWWEEIKARMKFGGYK